MEWTVCLFNLLIILLLILITWYIFPSNKTPMNLPPGPKGIPYLGYIPFLGKNPHSTMKKLSKKYGDLMTLYIGSERTIVVSSFKLIKEIFYKQGHIFVDRPESFKTLVRFSKEPGLIGSTSELSQALRKFSLSTFNNIGLGKTIMEPIMMEEINCIIEEIKNIKGQPTYLDDLLAKSVANIIFTTLFGKRMEYNDKKFLNLLNLSQSYIFAIGINKLSQFLPKFINYLLGIKEPKFYGVPLYNKLLAEISDTVHKELGDTDSFLNAWKLEAGKSDSNSKFYTDERLANLYLEFFVAGHDTTSKTLEFGILYLIKYPEIQKKVQQEIDNVIGKDRAPTMHDQKLMPYTEATLLEISRVAAVVPLALPHWSSEDKTVNGYCIPKDTVVIANIWAILNNEEVFSEPERFKPERFLSEDNKVIHNEELIPFSIGKRQCPGEALARMELFLYFTSFLQHFTFSKDDEVILKAKFSIALQPVHQKIRATLR